MGERERKKEARGWKRIEMEKRGQNKDRQDCCLGAVPSVGVRLCVATITRFINLYNHKRAEFRREPGFTGCSAGRRRVTERSVSGFIQSLCHYQDYWILTCIGGIITLYDLQTTAPIVLGGRDPGNILLPWSL